MSCGYSTNSTPANFWWQTSSFNELVLIATVIKLVKQALLYRSYTRGLQVAPEAFEQDAFFCYFRSNAGAILEKRVLAPCIVTYPDCYWCSALAQPAIVLCERENPANGRMALMSGLRESVSSVLLTSEGGVLHKPTG